MSPFIRSLTRWLEHEYKLTIKDNISDAEVDSWFLMDNAKLLIAIILAYLLFVLKVGPQIMENRKARQLKWLLLCYNLAIAIFNAYIFNTFLVAYGYGYPLRYLCVPHPNRNSLPFTRVLYEACWYYLLSKVIELFDTVFFIVRKKQNQVTVLHVYHHTSMVLNTWMYLKYLKTEQGIVIGFVNTFVHIIMYIYYFLAAFGPAVQKYLWWKKYITLLQLTQFSIVLTYLLTLLLMNCKVHRGLSIYMTMQTMVITILFLNFYRKSYNKHKSRTVTASKLTNNAMNIKYD